MTTKRASLRVRNSPSKICNSISRRDLLRLSAFGIVGHSQSGWLQALAERTANDPKQHRACILLWMTGGPSQMDTFDLKPQHKNGGPIKPIDTAVPGVQISEHLPKLATMMEHVVPVRSMKTKEGDHTRATYLLRTGYLPQGPIRYPTLGSLLSKELGTEKNELPNFVSIAPYRFLSPAAYLPGFLGPQHAPLVVGGPGINVVRPGSDNYSQVLRVKNLDLPSGIDIEQTDARLALLKDLEEDFSTSRPGVISSSHRSSYQAAVRMMRSESAKAFTLDDESDELRDSYGRNQFGQGCLLARRLVERGVPFVEVSLNGVQGSNTFAWDTHQKNFESVKQLSGILDPAWATLIDDLKTRGMLDSTLVVWMGEFGRTPVINRSQGRDHFPSAWTTVLSGGGIRGGQVYGKTSADGMQVEEKPVTVPDLLATVCRALDIDPTRQNISNVGRPIRIADPGAKPIEEILV